MKYIKKVLAPLKRAYSTNHLTFNEKEYVVYASEANVGEPGFAYAFDLDNTDHKETIWDNAGGCMSILQHPYKKDAFVAVQEFYLKEHPSKAKLVEGVRTDDGKYEIKELVKLPFLHRFGFIRKNQEVYLICCTIAKDKLDKEDWSKPGEVWVGKFPKGDEKIELRLLSNIHFHNHGFYQTVENGDDVIYISSDEGIFKIYNDGEFRVEKILDGRVGEIALKDIDNDGQDELITIEPFHGNRIKLYHLNSNGSYDCVWEYDHEIDFAHALAGDTLLGRNCFICGVRRKDAECIVVYMENGKIVYDVVDKSGGPANLCVIHHKGKDYVSCANHTANECALYEVVE